MTEMGDGHDESDWMHAKTMVKPDDQLQLSEAVSSRCACTLPPQWCVTQSHVITGLNSPPPRVD